MFFGYWNYYNYLNTRLYLGFNLINSFWKGLLNGNSFSPFMNFYYSPPSVYYYSNPQSINFYPRISDSVGGLLSNLNSGADTDINNDPKINITSQSSPEKVGNLLSNLLKSSPVSNLSEERLASVNLGLATNTLKSSNSDTGKSVLSPSTIKSSNKSEELVINSEYTADIQFSGSKVILGEAIKKRIKKIAEKVNCDYKDLLGLIYCESSFRTIPRNWNGRSAIGLIQFTDINIKDLNSIYGANLTKEKIAQMSPLEQLDWAEKSLLRAKQIAGFPIGHKLNAGELYAINFAPANAKRQSYISKKGDGLYEGNPGLDLNKDGKITREELGQKIKKGSINVVA